MSEKEQPSNQSNSRWGLRGKTFWDWLPILGTFAIPIVIAVGTWGITWQQGNIEEQRTQDAALQAYLDQIGTLLLENNLRAADDYSEQVTLARARTLTVLDRLDSEHQSNLMRFLAEAGLINNYLQPIEESEVPPIILTGADLQGADLGDLVLTNTFMSGTNLRGANLRSAQADRAHFSGADLREADLTEADLRNAELRGANLSGAQLNDAILGGTIFTDADLSGADLRGAYQFAGDASGPPSKQLISNERLEDQAASLEDATMPNGQKYEVWLKSNGKDN